MSRFRANIVVKGLSQAWEEDSWQEISINSGQQCLLWQNHAEGAK
jgi:uncharacterized protein YcbX